MEPCGDQYWRGWTNRGAPKRDRKGGVRKAAEETREMILQKPKERVISWGELNVTRPYTYIIHKSPYLHLDNLVKQFRSRLKSDLVNWWINGREWCKSRERCVFERISKGKVDTRLKSEKYGKFLTVFNKCIFSTFMKVINSQINNFK